METPRAEKRPLSGLLHSTLTGQQGALALDTPSVAGECAALAHHPMTRNGDGNGVRRASAGDGTHGRRRSYFFREFSVSHASPRRNLAQSAPDALLKSGAANVERKIEADGRALDEGNDFRHGGLERAVRADQPGFWKPLLEKMLTDSDQTVVATVKQALGKK